MRLRLGTTVLGAGVLAGSVLLPAWSATAATAPHRAAIFHPPIVTVAANQSNNWSGYNQGALEKGTEFQGVAGDWIVPTASQHKSGEAEYSSSWVGIGGGCVDSGCTVTDETLIQAGTEQDAGNTGGPLYYAWWEIIPAPSVEITDSSGNPEPVSPGDYMHVAITQTAPQVWSILVQDTTKGWTFTQSVPYSSSYATAEWIEETPVTVSSSGGASIGPLPNLSTVKMDNAETTSQAGGTLTSANLSPSEEMQLVDSNGQPLATPSGPDPDTDGFNDCSYASSCPAPSGDIATTTSGTGGPVSGGPKHGGKPKRR